MEISTTTSVFTWSDEAKQVIKELIVLDNNTRDAQRIFFERLYTMWLNDGLEKITDAKAIDHFKREKNYINKTIFLSLPANVQEEMNYVETTYKNLLKGIGYITTDDENDIVPASLEAISKFRRLRNLNSDKIRYRYNAILNDFLQFIKEKKSESEADKQASKSNVAREIRNKLDRFAKKNAEEKGYGGQGSSNSGAKKGKGKKRKSAVANNSDDSDDDDEVNMRCAFILLKHLICNILGHP